MTDAELVIEALKKLKAMEPKPAYGICEYLRGVSVADDYYEWRKEVIYPLFEKWGHFSGSNAYPVPSKENNYSSYIRAFVDAQQANTMYDPTTEYGRLRLELIDFLIKELSKENKT